MIVLILHVDQVMSNGLVFSISMFRFTCISFSALQDLKEQVEKLLAERSEFQSKFDQLARQRGANLSSEGVDQINEHFLAANEELKNNNEVRQRIILSVVFSASLNFLR